MQNSTYTVKNLLNVLTCLILVGGGICLIILAFSLPTKLPFVVLGHIALVELIIAGVALIILSLVPMLTFFNRANLTRKFNKRWRKQTVYELAGLTGEETVLPISPIQLSKASTISEADNTNEKFSWNQTVTTIVQDPRKGWNGQDIEALISDLNVDHHGGLVFPASPATFSSQPRLTFQLSQTEVDPTPEAFHFYQTEKVTQLIPYPTQLESQESFFQVVDQIGYLTFPLPPPN
jgi:hypothetical protein